MGDFSIWIRDILMSMGLGVEATRWAVLGAMLFIMILVAILSYIIVHKVLAVGVRKFVQRTSVTWDDALFNDKLLSSVSHLVPPLLVYILMPWLLHGYELLHNVCNQVMLVYIVIVSVRVVNVLLSSIYLAISQTKNFEGHSLKGLMQMLKILVICVGLIIIISLLINKNPLIILSGLGASAAILMLVFKDSIVGLVAGIQLSANDMLKPGDWIEVPKHGVNGVVEDVSLTTVKVRNWDMTIVTVPPYSLVSESFQNWRGMQMSGGRRVKRSINIDVNSVRFISESDLSTFAQQEWYKGYSSPSQKVVNLHLFRYYIEQYLVNHAKVNKEMLMMVRQLQPTNYGLPIELYFFTATTQWVEYENIQAEVFDHLFAVAHDFGLRIFQSPSGLDFKSVEVENK